MKNQSVRSARTRAGALLLVLSVGVMFASCGDEEDEALEGLEVVDLGSVEVVNLESEGVPLSIEIPDGAESALIVLEGAGTRVVTATKIESPSGVVVYDFNEDITTNRTDPVDGLYTILLPNNPAVTFESGAWKFTYAAEEAFSGKGTALIKASPATEKLLDLNLFFVGVDGLTAEAAQADSNFQEVMGNVEAVYKSAGINFGTVNYMDVTGDDAGKFGTIDSIDGANNELAGLFELSAGQENRALNFFFVADIGGGDAGFTLLGLSGGVPGPGNLHGTTRSGVAVNMADYIAATASGDAEMLKDAKELTEIIMAHESAHFLGLFHTVERNGTGLDESGILGQDPLSDTPLCEDSADANDDKVLQASECSGKGGDNLMFWSPTVSSRTLTSNRRTIITRNPLVR